MKVYVCDTWDSLSDIGESIIDNRAYVTREAAERRAERIRRGGHDRTDEYARVVELELCAAPSNTDRLIAERTAWYLHAKNVEAENAKLKELVNDMWICISHGSEDCTGCKRDPDSVCVMGISEFSYRMRELGIEVEVGC